jgi:hypothetical protein
MIAPVLIFREQDEESYRYSRRDILSARANMAAQRLRDVVERQHVVKLNDSVRAAMPHGTTGAMTVEYDRAFTGETRQRLTALAADATIDRLANPVVPVDLRFVLDSSPVLERSTRRGFGGGMTIDYRLPRADDERCLVVARIHPRLVAELASDIARERLLGPCAFYHAFGRPGPAVERWLVKSGWMLAQMGTWRGDVRKWGGTRWIENDDYSLREVIGERGYRCATGSDSLCIDAVLDPRIASFRVGSGILSTANYNPFTSSSYWYSRNWSFGQRAPYFLADMVRDHGVERFARFWQSDRDLPVAFQTATGSSLAGWTRAWLERVYHAERTGPAASPAATAWALALVVLAVALSTTLAERRQMG